MKFSDLYVNEKGRVSMAMIMLWLASLTIVLVVVGSVFGGFTVGTVPAGLLMGLAALAMANRADSRRTSIKALGMEFSQDRGGDDDGSAD